jgi:hypothetical protein
MTEPSTDREISASEWRLLRIALTERLRSLTDALASASTPAEEVRLRKEIEDLKQKISTLAVEETIAQFVEDAERYVVAVNSLPDDFGRDPDEEPV